MAYWIEAPSKISGTVHLPASKSISNRLLILRALSHEEIVISNLSKAQDTKTLDALLNGNNNTWDCGPAGTAMRFLTAYASGMEGSQILTGSKRMKERPIGELVDALRHLGAKISYVENEGYPPMEINGGELIGGEVEINASISSQFISALMLIAPSLEEGLTINLSEDGVSQSYIEMTLRILSKLGIKGRRTANQIRIEPGPLSGGEIRVESDWSAASYWYSTVALAEEAEIELIGLQKPSWQGDSIVAELFTLLGVATEYTDEGVILTKVPVYAKELGYNFINCPDLAQTLVVTTAALGIPIRFSGLETLKIKETDRVDALKSELLKVGAEIEQLKVGEITCFPPSLRNPNSHIKTFDDHRMAMSFAPLACQLDDVIIDDPGVTGKSYPDFWSDLASVGFRVEEL